MAKKTLTVKKPVAEETPNGAKAAEVAIDAVKAKKAAVADQFAEADAKADPAELTEQDMADLQVQRSVRGW